MEIENSKKNSRLFRFLISFKTTGRLILLPVWLFQEILANAVGRRIITNVFLVFFEVDYSCIATNNTL